MSDQEQYADEYVPGDGETAESWEAYDEGYEPSETEVLRAELADLREQMAQTQQAPQYYQPEPVDTSEADATHWQNEITTLRNMLGRDISPVEAANMKRLTDLYPAANPSMIDAYEAQAALPRQERWKHALDAQRPEPSHEFYPDPDDWSDDPQERAAQRQAAALARHNINQGLTYEPADD